MEYIYYGHFFIIKLPSECKFNPEPSLEVPKT